MPQLYQVLTISGLNKIGNPTILEQFVEADRKIIDGISDAPLHIAQAIRNAIREVN